MRFEEQGVVVTGGGSGIGQQVCYLAAKEGARVAVADIDLEKAQATAEEIRRTNGAASAYQLDVTDPQAVAGLIDAAAKEFGRLDVLVNSAGVREIEPVLDLSYEEWQRVIGNQSQRHISAEPGIRPARCEFGRKGSNRQSRLHPRSGSGSQSGRVHGIETRRRWIDQADGVGAR